MKKSVFSWILCLLIVIAFFATIVLVFNTRQTSQIIMGNSPVQDQFTAQSSNSIIEGKLNINTASAEELEMLPGIGKALAQEIISYRIKNGTFKSIEDLLKVKGIGPVKFSRLKDYITTG